MNDSFPDLIDKVSHQLNSPLASAKSYVYLSKRALEKQNIEKTTEYLDSLEDKIDLLTKRIDLLLTLLTLKNGKPVFTYTIFPASQITGNVKHKTEVMADLDLIKTVFDYAAELTGSDTMTFSSDNKTGTFTMADQQVPDSSDKDIRTERLEKKHILSLIIELHGGAVVMHEDEWQVSIPLKPARKK